MGGRGNSIPHMGVGSTRTHQQADLQQPAGAAGSIAHPARLAEVERQRALAEDMLALFERRDDGGGVLGAGQADVDRIDGGIGDQRIGIGDGSGATEVGDGPRACGVARKHAHDLDVRQVRPGRRVRGTHRPGAQDADPDDVAQSTSSQRPRAMVGAFKFHTKHGGPFTPSAAAAPRRRQAAPPRSAFG